MASGPPPVYAPPPGAGYGPPPGYGEYPPPGYGAPPPGYYGYSGPAAGAPASDPTAEIAALKAENAALKAENASLKAENASLKAGGAPPSSSPAMIPPPNLAWPPPYGAPPPGYPGYPPPYGAPPPGYGAPPPVYGAPPPAAKPPTLPMNNENKRGPKGANLAVFCIPNGYHDQNVLDLCAPYGTVVFCQVATHRETGASRGYAFVSYETVEMANNAIGNLHNMTVEGRALRVELARADKESKPY